MKTLTAFLFVFLNFSIAYSQFSASLHGDNWHTPANLSVYQPRHTGNDIINYNGDVYAVTVWENTSGTSDDMIGWYVGGSTGQGTLTYSTRVKDPDVCLVEYNGDVYAIVVYYHTGSSDWFWETFIWNGSSFASNTIASAFDNGNGTSVNIDANDHSDGQFVIVWDNAGDIYAVTGDIANSSLNSNVGVANGTYPDVSLYYDGTDNIAHITYLDNNGELFVDDHDYSTLSAGSAASLSNVLTASPSTGYTFKVPRIASPNGNNSNSSNWTVVLEEIRINNQYRIIGFSDGNATSIIYNDGFYLTDISSTENYFPTVTYDSNYPTDGIWICWTYSDGTSDVPIGLKCDNSAIPVSTSYLEVPNGFTSGDYCINASIAGRYASDELFISFIGYVYNGNSNNYVYIKYIANAGSQSTFRNLNNLVGNLLDDKSNRLLNIKLYDITGKLILTAKLPANEYNRYILNNNINLPANLYLVQIISDNGDLFLSEKIFITNK